ncbi:threonine synthase [Pseudohongiella sp.]|uniref:threonine synthase n=1 Tax=marine sediment metagenome TaxID=412755 RepID=A0A0F9W3P1_9ZZZZ|nr:threonine synthase [Pseudohongiella sp.]HDZ09588.1 threonine synthase [Pseudohongiella sp.]HEA62502.1 threonine synthase [Pseudohongiella sp.]
MKYISTRGKSPACNFEQVLLTGLAPDGGLYVPESLPQFSAAEIASWAGLPYDQLAFNVIKPFIDGEIPDDVLQRILSESYQSFTHKAVAPLRQLDANEWVLELYCGPTLAFKDFALQLLGRLLDYVLTRDNKKVAVLGATSGDTGSAALEGCRHCDNIDLFILHPYQRVSDVQRRQMTTVPGDNVHNIAVRGNFDDCQRIVKAAFGDQSFLPADRQLVAVNSINWARIMAQIVYYFYASLNLGGPLRPVSFSVPTGNFGDIYAGYLARSMGLPINQLIIATNRNDILHRLLSDNEYSLGTLEHTLSPSMDIMVSSNFERYLFDLFDRDADAVTAFVTGLGNTPQKLNPEQWQRARELFSSLSVDDDTTCKVIAQVYKDSEFLIDPHTAIGVHAARVCNKERSVPMITLATAHPVKFADAVEKAGLEYPTLPEHLQDLMEREERYDVLDNDIHAITEFMQQRLC